MGKVNFPDDFQACRPSPTAADVVAHSPTPSMVSTAALVERRRIEGAGRMAEVMLGKQKPFRPVEIAARLSAVRFASKLF